MSHARTRLRALIVTVLAVAIAGTTGTAAHAAPSTAEIKKSIDKASDQLEDVVEAFNKVKISLAKTKADEKTLAASLGPAKEALEAASAQVGTIANAAYKTGKVGPMTVLLDGNGDVITKMSLLDQVSRANQRKIDEYTATTKNYNDRQAALKATREKQTAEVKELEAREKKIKADLKKLYAMRTAAYGTPTETGSSYTGKVPSVSGSAGVAVRFAFAQIGEMYLYGSSGPNTWDCSGLTQGAWGAAGRSLPHNAAAQYSATSRITRAQLQPGDLVFYRSLGHVAIYVGGGMIIDASRAGQPVKHRDMDIMPPYGYGRV